MLEGTRKYTITGITIGVKIGDDDAKIGKNPNLLVIMCANQSQKVGLLDLTNWNLCKNKTARNNVQKLCLITAEFI